MASLSLIIALTAVQAGQAGQIQLVQDTHGSVFYQAPARPDLCRSVILLIHGTPAAADVTAQAAARAYIERWSAYAAQRNAAVIVPAFDQPNFASLSQGRRGLEGGYRGLFGRHIDADTWVNQLMDQVKKGCPSWNGRVFLFGHSAGGQFAAHYLLKHQDRLRACFISSPALFPMPNSNLDWPEGAKPRTFKMNWGDGSKVFKAGLELSAWVKALSVPVHLAVGSLDVEKYQAPFPGSKAMDHVEALNEWHAVMGDLAQKSGVPYTWKKTIAPNQPHSSSLLAPWAMDWFDEIARGQ